MGLFGIGGGNQNRRDFTTEMLPKNRFELFFEMVKLNFFTLLKVNLLYLLFTIPFWLVILSHALVLIRVLEFDLTRFVQEGYLTICIIGCSVSFLFSGPAKTGLKYITRNIARDEHVWLSSDFFGTIRSNLKQSLALSALNGLVLFLFYYSFYFYRSYPAGSGSYNFFLLMLLCVAAVVYMMLNLYAWPMMITYKLTLGQILRNSLILAIGRLPQTLLFGLLTAVPVLILLVYLPSLYLVLLWYALIGYSLGSFINASYTNSVFDRYFNTRIEGAEIGHGMQKPDEDDEDEEDENEDVSTIQPSSFFRRKPKKQIELEDLDADEDDRS